MKYNVKLESFEGPFDLLLSLIGKHKIDIYEISLADIIRDYLEYLKKMKQLDLEVASEFIVIAATLLQIKVGSLLSSEEEEEYEEISPSEARELLIARLLEYKKFKNASEYLADLFENEYGFCKRRNELDRQVLARTDLLERITTEDLAQLLAFMLIGSGEGDVVVSTEHILIPPVNLKDKIEFVLDKLKTKGVQTFRSLTGNCRTKMEAAVTFLALLELYRRREVELNQITTFGDIEIKLIKTDEELMFPDEQDVERWKDTQA